MIEEREPQMFVRHSRSQSRSHSPVLVVSPPTIEQIDSVDMMLTRDLSVEKPVYHERVVE